MIAAARSAVARWRWGDDPARIAEALAGGALVAFPTESSYGLGARPRDASGVAAIHRLKGRAADKALPVVAADVAALAALGVELDCEAIRWATPRWPAALTVVAPLAAPIAASAGRRELAVRVPGGAELRALLAALGGALTATSANPSGAEPYLDPDELAHWLEQAGQRAVVIGDQAAPGGPASTLVRFEEGSPRVLRPGRLGIA